MAKAKKAKPVEPIIFPQQYMVVAADLSLKRPGFCKFIVSHIDNETKIESFETMSVDNKTTVKSHGELLNEILKAIVNFFPDPEKTPYPIYYVREQAINSRAAMSEIGIFKVVGVTEWYVYGLNNKWHEIYPVSVKKLVTGSGKADKDVVAKCLPYYFGEHTYANDDESDAAAVGAAFLVQHEQMKSIASETVKKEEMPVD